MNRIITIVLVQFLFNIECIAQENSNNNKENQVSETSQMQYAIDKQQYNLFKKEMELKLLESNKEKSLYKKEIELLLKEYKQEKTFLDWIAIAVGGITVLSLFGFWQRVKSMAQKKIEEQFEVILDEKKGQLIKIIDSHDDEEKLKRKKKIRVITAHDSDVSFLNSFFKKFDFKHIEVIEMEEGDNVDLKDYNFDLLFLNREEGNKPLSDEMSQKLITDLPQDSIVFSFGKFINNYDENAKKRFAAATNWSQLYGNLISALKYQELIDIK
ncbi:hypothetical protein QYS49_36935 [Marivirga salinae]|uniref:Nucleotidyltransferase-Associated Rossmannoid Fold domain-containing protein n=1 Tax=Marivirga salinarum TaxID=3059078 RepID=A0AA51N9Y8_9BACT|nr:NARF domain-containing protein [Marivirga sp. BDSF4-3]WMN11030.1 hypothetical protein QYS49_36935 [Marivirga sp. BDSF4-3]